jgi:hypothetical protein
MVHAWQCALGQYSAASSTHGCIMASTQIFTVKLYVAHYAINQAENCIVITILLPEKLGMMLLHCFTTHMLYMHGMKIACAA